MEVHADAWLPISRKHLSELLKKNDKNVPFGNTYTIIYVAVSNLQSHNNMLPVRN